MQIIVLGPHRSGTSAVTRLINMMGAYFDSGEQSIGFNDENPKGFWERADVIAINDRLLASYQASWDMLGDWPDAPGEVAPGEAEGKCASILHDLKKLILDLDAHRPWIVKDPRLCLTFPYWRALMEVPVIVAVSRDPIEVARSMMTRNGFSFAHGLAIWEIYTVGMLNAARGLPTIHVEYKEVVARPVETVKTLFEALKSHGVQGLRLPEMREVTAFVEPSLYRSKTTAFTAHSAMTPFQIELAEMARGKRPLPAEPFAISAAARDVMQHLCRQRETEASLGRAQSDHAATRSEQTMRDGDWQHRVNLLNDELAREKQERHTREAALLNDTDLQRQQIETCQRDLAAIRQSTSWKIGQALARLTRRIGNS